MSQLTELWSMCEQDSPTGLFMAFTATRGFVDQQGLALGVS